MTAQKDAPHKEHVQGSDAAEDGLQERPTAAHGAVLAHTGQDDDSAFDPQALIRLGTTLRALRDEVREIVVDERAIERLGHAHRALLAAICDAVPGELQRELSRLDVQFSDDESVPSMRLAQSQLLGWIEGLFLGLQVGAGQPTEAPSQVRDPSDPAVATAPTRQDPRYL